jgi:hypothetical protein
MVKWSNSRLFLKSFALLLKAPKHDTGIGIEGAACKFSDNAHHYPTNESIIALISG